MVFFDPKTKSVCAITGPTPAVLFDRSCGHTVCMYRLGPMNHMMVSTCPPPASFGLNWNVLILNEAFKGFILSSHKAVVTCLSHTNHVFLLERLSKC